MLVAMIRAGETIFSSCALGPTRKAVLTRERMLPREYLKANKKGSPCGETIEIV